MNKTCVICGKELTGRQQRACSPLCASRCRGLKRPSEGYVTTEGYRVVAGLYSPRSRNQQLEHRVVAERALGRRLPPGSIIHHIDEDPLNNRNDNLVICQDRAYHMLIHMRARVLKAGGNPNTDKICDRCNKPLPFEAFGKNPTKVHGRDQACLNCRREMNPSGNANKGHGKYVRTPEVIEKQRQAALKRWAKPEGT